MTDDTHLTLREVVDELRTYTALVSDEWQESVDILCNAARYPYCYSDEFNGLLEKVLRVALQDCRDNAIIVEEVFTETYTKKTIEWD